MSYEFSRRTTAGLVKTGLTRLHTISISPTTATPTAGLLTIYDGTTTGGTALYSEWVFATTPGHTITLDVLCRTGVYVGFDGTLANVSVTASYE